VRRPPRLRRLARVRAIEEELARTAFAEAVQAAAAAEGELERARRALADARADTARRQRASVLDTGAILAAHGALDGLAGAIEHRRERLAERAASADRSRADWLERRRAVRALERLVDRARRRDAAEEARSENAAADERFSRHGSERRSR